MERMWCPTGAIVHASGSCPSRSAAKAVSAEDWRNTILARLANYIDGGSIVAGSAALALWVSKFHLSPALVGLIGAFSANAISAGIGALVGGWLCNRVGRGLRLDIARTMVGDQFSAV